MESHPIDDQGISGSEASKPAPQGETNSQKLHLETSIFPGYDKFLTEFKQKNPDASPLDAMVEWKRSQDPNSTATREEVVAQLFRDPTEASRFAHYAQSAAKGWESMAELASQSLGVELPKVPAEVTGSEGLKPLTAEQLINISNASLDAWAKQPHYDQVTVSNPRYPERQNPDIK